MIRSALTVSIVLLSVISSYGQQRPDTTFIEKITTPLFNKGTGPTVCIDAAHNNFHTAETGFAPLVKILKLDGFKVTSFKKRAEAGTETFHDCKILVIANALHENNINNWRLPNPSAFSKDEINNIEKWVKSGGRLFLIADHMPFAGAAEELGRIFGFEFNNGFASLVKEQNEPDVFNSDNRRLVTMNLPNPKINSVTTFTGSAFKYPGNAKTILLFKSGDFSLEPKIAWQFNNDTKATDISGYSQGAIMDYGKGKLAVFGEAAMFTAQIITTPQGEFKVGLNNKELAPQNLEFLRSLMKWLTQ